MAFAEIILHAGHFPGGLVVEPRRSAGSPTRLVLRAARDETDTPVAAVLDGGKRVAAASAVAGAPGVHRARVARVPFSQKLRLWEADTGRRYAFVADRAAVERNPGSYWYRQPGGERGDVEVFFHTSDGAPASTHDIWRSDRAYGIEIRRTNVTIEGLQFENFVAWDLGAAVLSRAAGTRIEGVRISNATRGIYLRPEASYSSIRACSAEDVETGVWIEASNTIVSDCRLFRSHRLDRLEAYETNDAGIEFYHPAGNAEVTGNLVVGFRQGLFIKTTASQFVVESNTFVAPSAGGARGMGPNAWSPDSVYRRNVVAGFRDPLPFGRPVGAGTKVDRNCLDVPGSPITRRSFEHHGTVAAPIFVDPDAGDFRLVHDGPCAGDPRMGALGFAPPDVSPAGLRSLEVSLEAPARRIDACQGNPRADAPAVRAWLAPEARVILLVRRASEPRQITALRIRLGDGPPRPLPADLDRHEIDLPPDEPVVALHVELRDARGRWQPLDPMQIVVAPSAPRPLAPVRAQVTRHGFVVVAEVDRAVTARLEYGPTPELGRYVAATSAPLCDADVLAPAPGATTVAAALLPPAITGDETWHWKLIGRDALGREGLLASGSFVLRGEPRTLHVAPNGSDAGGQGTSDRPYRTLQHALDRSLPGDEVVLADGVYERPAIIRRGGVPGAPLVVRSQTRWGAVLDGERRNETPLRIESAPHVVVDGLELRFFERSGIGIRRSPNVEVRNTRIWNDHWFGWIDGSGIEARGSSGLSLHHNVIFRTAVGIRLVDSPGARIVHNTLCANRNAGASLVRSVADTQLVDNSLAFNEITAYELETDQPRDLARFHADRNNLGMQFREPLEKERSAIAVGHRSLSLDRLPLSRIQSKFLVRIRGLGIADLQGGGSGRQAWKVHEAYQDDLRFHSLDDWRAASGQDVHSIFADPEYVDPLVFDFRPSTGSPNTGLGEGRSTIGALPAAGPP